MCECVCVGDGLAPKFRSSRVTFQATNSPFSKILKCHVKQSLVPRVRVLVIDVHLSVTKLDIRVTGAGSTLHNDLR